MSSLGISSRKRPGKAARAAAAAAKDRRQKVIAGGLGVVLIAVLAYEVPHLLKLSGGGKSPVVAVATTTPPVAVAADKGSLLKALRRTPRADPFAQPLPPNGDSTPSDVGAPAGSVDPFAGSTSTGGRLRAPVQSVAAGRLPEKIIIGKPGGNRVASHGWIVILASIPTGQGRGSATVFATKARSRGLSPVSVLNSSNSRPLRGGYWVVYTGPYATLGAVTTRARGVHSLGYPTAYIRELIVYR